MPLVCNETVYADGVMCGWVNYLRFVCEKFRSLQSLGIEGGIVRVEDFLFMQKALTLAFEELGCKRQWHLHIQLVETGKEIATIAEMQGPESRNTKI